MLKKNISIKKKLKFVMLILKQLEHKTVHLLGIGGIGMSAIALFLKALGCNVQGSDQNYTNECKRLEENKIKVFIGHRLENIIGIDYLVISSSIKESNIELEQAKKLGIIVAHRFDILSVICRSKFSILVTGSNGKTTITALTFEMMRYFGLKATVVLGGIMPKYQTNILYKKEDDYSVIETCESDGRFINLPSDVAIISSIDKDHLDFYQNIDNLIKHFEIFISRIPFYGCLIFCLDNETLSKTVLKVKPNTTVISYSLNNKNANVWASNIFYDASFTTYDLNVNFQGKKINVKDITIPVVGEYNLSNVLASIGLALFLNLDLSKAKNIFSEFNPVLKRFTYVGDYKNAKVIDDYAHNATKVHAVINAAKSIVLGKKGSCKGKLIVICELHRYSRIANSLAEFGKALSMTDFVFLIPVFAAGEEYNVEYNNLTIINYLKQEFKFNTVDCVETIEELNNSLSSIVQKDDLILVCGAGNSTKWAKELVKF
jgi:UDP-N-acetylmuramate--alanine ligase